MNHPFESSFRILPDFQSLSMTLNLRQNNNPVPMPPPNQPLPHSLLSDYFWTDVLAAIDAACVSTSFRFAILTFRCIFYLDLAVDMTPVADPITRRCLGLSCVHCFVVIVRYSICGMEMFKSLLLTICRNPVEDAVCTLKEEDISVGHIHEDGLSA